MAINSLTFTGSTLAKWTAQNTITGSNYQPLTNSGNIQKSVSLGTAAANAAVGGADQLISYIVNIAISSSTTIDLTSLTNILQQSGVSLARVKFYQFRLLSVDDDPVYGTLCSSVTIGNAASNSQQFNLSAAATMDVKTGGDATYFDPSASGYVVDGTHKNVKIVNNDATSGGSGVTSHVAAVQITLCGGSS